MPSLTIRFLSPLLRSENKGTGIPSGTISRQKNKKQFRTAQLHIQKQLNFQCIAGEERTPAKKEGMLHLLSSFSASLTIEASLVLPLFIAAMCILLFPLLVLDAQTQAQLEMEKTTEYIAVAQGVRRSLYTGTDGNMSGSRENTQGSGQPEKAECESDLEPSVLFDAVEEISGLAAVETAFSKNVFYRVTLPGIKLPTAEDPLVQLEAVSFVKFPFLSFLEDEKQEGLRLGLECHVRLISSRRAWVGRKGGYGKSYGADTGEKETQEPEVTEDRTVFIAKNSASSHKYHTDASCSYIHNSIQSVDVSMISEKRNKSQEKYYPCPSCRPGNSGIVYYFDWGTAYHASKNCKAITSYVTEMKESEAKRKGYTICSRCARKQ